MRAKFVQCLLRTATNCQHIGHFGMAKAQSVQQQTCPSLYRSYTSLGTSVVCSPRSIIDCL